jgi:hypothetical protein
MFLYYVGSLLFAIRRRAGDVWSADHELLLAPLPQFQWPQDKASGG